jgi:hypothetical protein
MTHARRVCVCTWHTRSAGVLRDFSFQPSLSLSPACAPTRDACASAGVNDPRQARVHLHVTQCRHPQPPLSLYHLRTNTLRRCVTHAQCAGVDDPRQAGPRRRRARLLLRRRQHQRQHRRRVSHAALKLLAKTYTSWDTGSTSKYFTHKLLVDVYCSCASKWTGETLPFMQHSFVKHNAALASEVVFCQFLYRHL